MTKEELLEKLNEIQITRCETQMLEIKAAKQGCPKRLYDTLSSFSNQDEGGILIFGIDEEDNYNECGVYDPQDLQKKVKEQCLQMQPAVRPLFSVVEKEGNVFVSAEVPGIDIAERPCFYKGTGRLKGSYIRVGDSDEHMTEYEVYSYEAFRKKYQDDIRTVPRATFAVLDKELLEDYIRKLRQKKPNLSKLGDEMIYELMSILRNGEVTLSALLLFCRYPQVYFPQLCITAVALPGEQIGEVGDSGERFIDNQRIEGSIPEMLDQAITFVRKNMRTKTIINPETGKREDRTDYPITAIREALLNSLVHRDYSIHTEGMPIQILMYHDRIEVRNPGGIYGRMTIDEIGKRQPDTRNPVLVTALEVMGITENRYSGIPTIRKSMDEYGLDDPIFLDERGSFTVILSNKKHKKTTPVKDNLSDKEEELLQFLVTPRSRQEVVEHLGLKSSVYAIQTYIKPLIEGGLVGMTIPDKPGSRNQRFVALPDGKMR